MLIVVVAHTRSDGPRLLRLTGGLLSQAATWARLDTMLATAELRPDA